MAKFARLFDIDEQTQVLITRELDEEEKEAPFKLKVATDYRGIYAAVGYGFKEEIKCDQTFETYDLEKAKAFYSAIVEAIEGGD
jgi:hypothetical protein